MKRLILLLALLLTPALFAQTAAENIAAGRAALTAHNLPLAATKFQAALTQEPANQTAAALLGIARVFNVTEKSASQAFMDTLGMESGGRNVYDWRAGIQDEDGGIVLPTNYNFAQIASFWQSTLVPESELARANLALVTNPNFLITLSASETKMPVAVNIDYADILMIRACLRAAEFLAHLGSGQNLNLNLDALYQVARGDMLTLQKVLNYNPNFLTAGSTIERTAAKAALQDMIALYNQASVAVRARPAGLNRLFMLDADALVEEAAFRQMLDGIERSIDSPVDVGAKVLHTGPLFGSSWSLRDQLPAFSATGFDVTAIPDASLGGVITGLSKEEIAAALANGNRTLAELGWEWVSPKPQGNSMRRYLALPGGKHLIMGTAGAYLTSTDGSTWTPGRIPGAGQIEGIAANDGKIVAASLDGSLYLSTDNAASWRRIYGSDGAGFHSVTYGAGKFVAVGNYGQMAISEDGESWEENYPFYASGLDVIHTGTRFIVSALDEGTGNSQIYTSDDGWSWQQRLNSSTQNAYFLGLAQGGGKVVAVGLNNNRAVSSDGGLTWSTGTALSSGTTTLNDLVYANGKFVAVGAGGLVATSTDGTTWSSATVDFVGLIGAGVNGSTTYVFGGGGVILTSTDNTTFTRVPGYFSTAANIANPNLLTIRAIDGKLYVGGNNNTATPATGGIILRSDDGVSFSKVSENHGDVWDIIKQGSTFYAVGGVSASGGTTMILTSSDGATWTAQATTYTNVIRSISYLNGQFILTGTGGMIRTSATGANNTWTQQTTNVPTQLLAAAYGNGTYVVVGGSNNAGSPACTVLTSPDGVTWTFRPAGTNATLRGVVFYQGVFTAVGTDGEIIRSTNGVNWWSARADGVNTVLNSITVRDGRYYVTQANANLANTQFEAQAAVLISSDGENWVRVLQGTVNTPNKADLFNGRLYTSHGGATLLRSQVLASVAAPAPVVLTPDTLADQGGSLTLAVNPGSDGSTTYQWLKDDVPIDGATGVGFTLDNIQPDAAGTYKVAVTNAGGTTVSGPIVVTVSGTATAPVIVAHPASITQRTGTNASLEVEVTGTSPITYVWKKDGNVVNNAGNVTGATTASLTFTGLTAANAGTYTVTATNSVNSVTSLPAVLNVDNKPAYNFTNLAGLAGAFATVDATGFNARFDNPHGVAVDASGNVYVASPQSHTIRKVTSGGVVTTIAGLAYTSGNVNDTGTAARFNQPRGVALNAAGTILYVADTGNNSIRKVDLSTNAVTNLATGTFSVTALVAHSSGDVYYTGFDSTVRKVTSAGVVSVLAGAGSASGFVNATGNQARFNGPMGIALDSAGTNLYVADSGNACIRKVVISSGVVTTHAGQPGLFGADDGVALSATFSYPMGIAIDATGNMFVTDNGADVIRRISPVGTVVTIGGEAYHRAYRNAVGTDAWFSGPAGIAIDTAGALYLAENYNHVIRKGTLLSSATAPVIELPPASASVAAGGNVTFSVIASGAATLSYQWKHNGANIGGANSATLTLNAVDADDAGDYRVLVTNGSGAAISAPATLIVTVPPSIGTQPVAQSVTTGQSATLSVAATDSGDVTYQWRRNGFDIPGAIGATYTIPNATRADADYYDVVINGTSGSVTSAPSLVSIAPSGYPGVVTVDPAFQPNPTTISTRVYASLPLAGGKWLVGGEFVRMDAAAAPGLARLNADLSPDVSYTAPQINGTVYALAQAPDGSVYVGGDFSAVDGHTRRGLAKLTPSLALDLTWRPGDNPPAQSIVTALAVQADGKPLVARMSFTAGALPAGDVLRRLKTDGTLDDTFSTSVAISSSGRINQLIVEPAGSIVLAGAISTVNSSPVPWLTRVTSVGAVDTNFLSGGAANNAVNTVTRLADGRYLVAGQFNMIGGVSRNRVAILTSAGAVDTSFTPISSGNTNGNVYGAAMLSDGRVVLGGNFTSFAGSNASGLVQLSSNGSAVNRAFTSGGGGPLSSFPTTNGARSLALYPFANDAVAAFGIFQGVLDQRRVGVAVINTGSGDGSVANPPSMLFYRPAYTGTVLLGSDGKLSVFGSLDVAAGGTVLNQIGRFNPNGTVDGTFPAGEGVVLNGLSTFGFYRVVRQGDGKYVGLGDLIGYDGQPAYKLVRMNADGTIDSSFQTWGGPSSHTVPFITLAGGKILFYNIPSGFTYNGGAAAGLLRLNADGARDGGFSVGVAFGSSSASAVIEQPGTGKLYAAGAFSTYQNVASPGIVRILPDGSRDASFNPGTGLTSATVNQLLWLRDGRLLIAGAFTSYNGTTVNRIAIISADGTLDGSFTADAAINGAVGQVIEQEDGKLIVAGDFTGQLVYRLTATGALDNSFALRGITGAPGSNGTATRLILDDAGRLYVYNTMFSINYGTPQSLLRFGTAPVAPTVTTPPASVTAAVGSTAIFSVRAGGTAPYTYQWRHNTEPISGATDSVLVLAGLDGDDAGSYDVVVTNATSSETSTAATLTVSGQAQTITFNQPADVPLASSPITLVATSTSGLTVTFTVQSGPATVSGSQLTLTGAGSVTVRASQAGDASYAAATPVERSFTVLGGFANWTYQYFTEPERANASISGPNAIYGQDGLPNLVKYALGLAPKVNATTGLPEVSTNATHWIFTYSRPADRADITYVVQYSTNLTSWTDIPSGDHTKVSDGSTQVWKAIYPLSAANVFFRLKVAPVAD